MSNNLTKKEAYEAMYDFLIKLYNRTKSDAVGGLLSDMGYLPDGKPADPAVWEDWLESVAKARSGKVDMDLNIGHVDPD